MIYSDKSVCPKCKELLRKIIFIKPDYFLLIKGKHIYVKKRGAKTHRLLCNLSSKNKVVEFG